MKKTLLLATILLSTLSSKTSYAASRACCSAEPRWYGSLGGSLMYLKDYDLTYSYAPTGASAAFNSVETNIGYGFNTAIGHRIGKNIRAELELGFYQADVDNEDDFTIPAGTPRNAELSPHRSTALMANLIYDFGNRYLTPYIGAGAGGMYVNAPVSIEITDLGTGNALETRELNDIVFAYQFMAGFNYDIETKFAQRSQIYTGYRYIASTETEIEFKTFPGLSQGFKHESHNIDIGIRFYF